MGVFGGSKYYVSTASFRLINSPVDAVESAVMNAIAQDGDIAAHIKDTALLNGMASKTDRLFRYARTKYTLGLPGGITGNYSTIPEDDIAEFLKDDLNIIEDILIESDVIMRLDQDTVLMTILTKERGYYGPTGRISIFPPTAPATAPENKMYVNRVIFDPVPSTTMTVVYDIFEWILVETWDGENYIYTPTLIFVEEFSEEFDLGDEYFMGEFYCIVKYSLLDGNGAITEDTLWWFYRFASGKYPKFEYKRDLVLDSFLPVIPIRYENTDLTDAAHKDTPLYKTSKQLLNQINLKIDGLADTLNNNPTIADIDHAYVMYGIDVQETEPIGIRYLVEYFDHLFDKSIIDQPNYEQIRAVGGLPPTNLVTHGDNVYSVDPIELTEHGLNIDITFDYINSTTEAEVIGTVGHATRSFSTYEFSYEVPADYTDSGDETQIITENRGTLTLKLQITATIIKKIIVKNLEHTNNVYPRKNKKIITSIYDVVIDPDEHNLIIPIHMGVAQLIETLERAKLFEQGLRIVINTRERVHTDWYNSGAFGAIITAVGMVLQIFTGPIGTWIATLGTVASFVLRAVVAIVIASALTQVLTLVAGGLSTDLALIVGVIVTIISAVYTGGALTLISAVSSVYNKFEQYGIQSDLEDLASEYDTLQAEQDKLDDLLEDRADRNPLVWVKSIVSNENRTEKADAFLIRTSNIGNTAILDGSKRFVESLIGLPEADNNNFLILT